MKVKDWLDQAQTKLNNAQIGTARLDALVLLEDVTGIDRAKLLAESETEISASQIKKLKNVLKQRSRHMPLAYVRGKTEFYGREFLITPDVLEPRPESETMIDEFLKLPDLPTQPKIADVGTGSGALGITAKLEMPKAQLELIDIDAKALKVAKTNVDKFTPSVKLSQSDLLSTTSGHYDVLLCNLPYVPDDFTINIAASHEPRLAIYGGSDGLDVYRRLFKQLLNRSLQPLYILCEALPTQHGTLSEIANKAGYKSLRKNDFIAVYKRAQK